MGQRKKEPIIDIMTMITIRVEKAIRYQGKHEPIITKELFEAVQEQIKNSDLVRQDNIELAFTKLMVCGLCGSGISATEKFKKFQMMITGKKQNIDINDVDVKNYIKFLLQEGNNQEKRELLTCLNGGILLDNKVVKIK